MAWLSRKHSGDPSPSRAAQGKGQARRTSEDRDARLLRLRARHRLIGALALVLAVSVVLPMLLDGEPDAPPPVPDVLQVIPPVPSTLTDAGQPAQTAPAQATPARESSLPAVEPVPLQPPPTVATPPAAVSGSSGPSASGSSVNRDRASTPSARSDARPPAPPSNNRNNRRQDVRTDDGVLALSLLEGSNSPQTQAAQGQVALQVLALSSDAEAQKQREQLAAAGVGNVYVQTASVNGKPTYRLRVGPFPTRQAAQAAQASLRTLGWADSFIVDQ